ncbi:MAG: ATP-dependent helicase HrpB [Gammaproteobacteria bacterium]|nr:MAG: ATP-dependent helicase HrpB [Gammaproteobacteria bacterium]
MSDTAGRWPLSVADLPVMVIAEDVCAALQQRNVLLRAEPGAGKSTGLPLALLEDASPARRILLLEPRRIAARAVAERLAAHLGERVGQRIGLRMRGETRTSRNTLVEVVTEGVLTRQLQNDPMLESVALVVFDEFHERSLQADLGFALCREVQLGLRDDLRLLMMSATLDTEAIAEALGDAETFDCAVRQHPVEIRWCGESREPLPQRVASVVRESLPGEEGDMLVFLPGVGEIRRCASVLLPSLPPGVVLLELHGGVSAEARRRALAPASTGERRVILASAIAETSVTIDGVRVVIDAGLERRACLDTTTSAERLETVSASQASATQRAGRAGRTGPGVCIRLWNESGHVRREAQWQPEILRAELTSLLLELDIWGATDAFELPWLTPPPQAHLDVAAALLDRLELRDNGRPTAEGRAAAALPTHPRIAAMLLWAERHGVSAQACHLAAVLDGDGRRAGATNLDGVLCSATGRDVLQRAQRLRQALSGHGDEACTDVSDDPADMPADMLAVLLARAWPDWIAKRRPGQAGRFQLACGAGAVLREDDPLAHEPWLAVAALGGAERELRIFRAASLDVDTLVTTLPELVHERTHVEWDDRQERLIGEQRRMLGRHVLAARPLHGIDADLKAEAMIAAVRKKGIGALPWNDATREWQARVLRMRGLNLPQNVAAYPDVSDKALLDSLDTWLLPFLGGINSMKALAGLNLSAALAAMLDYPQQQLLDAWLPERYEVPTGSRIRLHYQRPGNPVLSVRLQEMLGCASNPTLAAGQLPLTVELLSPAGRPVQLTEDLVRFWTSSYPAVKKDMAGRYPKHPWPDNPLEAEPTRHAKRRSR